MKLVVLSDRYVKLLTLERCVVVNLIAMVITSIGLQFKISYSSSTSCAHCKKTKYSITETIEDLLKWFFLSSAAFLNFDGERKEGAVFKAPLHLV